MNVRQLIALLEDAPPTAEVRLAVQPEWPLACNVRGVAYPDDLADEEDLADYRYVYIVEGGSAGDGYAPRAAFDVAVS